MRNLFKFWGHIGKGKEKKDWKISILALIKTGKTSNIAAKETGGNSSEQPREIVLEDADHG